MAELAEGGLLHPAPTQQQGVHLIALLAEEGTGVERITAVTTGAHEEQNAVFARVVLTAVVGHGLIHHRRSHIGHYGGSGDHQFIGVVL